MLAVSESSEIIAEIIVFIGGKPSGWQILRWSEGIAEVVAIS